MSDKDLKVFDALVQEEEGFTFLTLPFSPREAWGARPRYKVAGTIDGKSVTGTLGALGQDYFLRLGKKWMRANGIELGAEVNVHLALASEPPR